MRIAYGVFGYGRGHTTRALAVLPELERRHHIQLFAGGMAYEMLSRDRQVVEVPAISYRYVGGRMATLPTLADNAGRVLDVLLGGPALDAVVARLRAFGPDVAICDVDPWTHRAAARLGIPRISFDHYGILAHCRPPVPLADQLRLLRDVTAYRSLTHGAERVVVSSFYEAPARRPDVACVGTLLRDAVHQVAATRGERLLAYFNQPALLTPRVEAALAGCGVPVVVYGTARRGHQGALEFRAPSERGFLQELARCRAVVGTAGNQLVGEALHFAKPMLVMPEDSVEQRLNAGAVERCGIGQRVDHRRLTAAVVRQFLDEEQRFRDRTRWHARDGRAEAVAALERFAAELAGTATNRAALAEVA